MRERRIIDMTPEEAKAFFLLQPSYFNLPLPPYISFEPLLETLDSWLEGYDLKDFFAGSTFPKDLDDVNYKMFVNKDGGYAWRPFQIIHPLLYVDLVHCLTSPENWRALQGRFNLFALPPHIHCASTITYSGKYTTSQPDSIINWWHENEQAAIAMAIDYDWMIKTDITDCYGSFYTHTLPWALHGKTHAKAHRNEQNLGNTLDQKLRNMNSGQTNGIPQGSVLMDFIAEIVLGYIDIRLYNELERRGITSDYDILRFRDDYQIFTRESTRAEEILTTLSEILAEFGFKLNSIKTKKTEDLIGASIKPDKIAWSKECGMLYFNQEHIIAEPKPQKYLLAIRDFSIKYPNSGSLQRALKDFYIEQIEPMKLLPSDAIALLSIVADIAVKNPRTHILCTAIISKLLVLMGAQVDRLELTKRIVKKFSKIPNNAYLEVCLQRLTYKVLPDIEYRSKFCHVVAGQADSIWNSVWTALPVDAIPIVDPELLQTYDEVVSSKEVELFNKYLQ